MAASPGKMSAAELREHFDQIDVDRSGSITAEELMIAMARFGIKCTRNSARKVLSQIDTDGNGTVEWSEFRDFFSRISDPEDVKALLSQSNWRFFDYKQLVESDPTFGKQFHMPPLVPATSAFLGHSDNVEHVEWLSDSMLISASIDGKIAVWEASRGGPKKIMRASRVFDEPGPGQPIYSMHASASSRHVLTGHGSREGSLWLWALAEGAPTVKFEGHSAPVYSCSMSADAGTCISGGKGGLICVHDASRPEAVAGWKGHAGIVHSLRFDAAGSKICTASADGSIKIFDLRGEAAAASIEEAAASGVVYQARWLGGHEIVSAGEDYCAKRWDLRNLSKGPVGCFFGHTKQVKGVELSPDGRFLVTACLDGSARVWLTDEMGLLSGRLDAAEQRAASLRLAVEEGRELCQEGEGDIDQVRADGAALAECVAEVEAISRLQSERKLAGSTQAALGLHGHSLSVQAAAWRDLGGGAARVATSSADASVLIFDVDTEALLRIRSREDEA